MLCVNDDHTHTYAYAYVTCLANYQLNVKKSHYANDNNLMVSSPNSKGS